MKRWLLLWLPVFVAVLLLLAFGGVYWALGTESGARFVLARAKPYLPRPLQLENIGGTLMDGVRFDRVGWQSDAFLLDAEAVFAHVELRPLLRRQVNVHRVEAAAVSVVLQASDRPSAEPPALPVFSMPIGLDVRSSSLRSITVETPGSTYRVDELALVGRIDGDDIELASLAAAGERFRLELSGELALRDPHPAALVAEWQWQAGDGTGYGGVLRLGGARERYDVQHQLTAPLEVRTEGFVAGLPAEPRGDLTSTWNAIGWPFDEPFVTSAGGTLRLAGTPSAYAVSLDAAAEWSGYPAGRVGVEGNATTGDIDFSRLTVVTPSGRIEASGTAGWRVEPFLDYSFSLDEFDVSLLKRWFQDDRLTGVLSAEGSNVIRFAPDGVQVELGVERLDGEIDGRRVDGDGNLRYAGGMLYIDQARAAIGSNSATVAGSVGEQLALDASFELGSIDALVPGVSGSLNGNASLRGPRSLPYGSLRAAGAGLAWRDYRAQRLQVEFDSTADGTGRVSATLGDGVLAGKPVDSAVVSATGSLEDHVASAAFALAGIDVAADLAGGFQDTAWHGRIERFEASGDRLGRWSSSEAGTLAIAAERSSLDRLCLDGSAGRACLTGSVESAGPASLDVLLTGLPMDGLPLGLPEEIEVKGTVAARAILRFEDGVLNGAASAAVSGLSFASVYEGDAIGIDFPEALLSGNVEAGRLQGAMRLVSTDGNARADAQFGMADVLDAGSAIRGTGRLRVDRLTPFAVFLPDLGNLAGHLAGEIGIGGNLRAPAVTGEISLGEAAFDVRRAGISITDLNATLRQPQPGRLELLGSARSGDGQVSISGTTRMGSEAGIRTEISIAGSEFQIVRLPDWNVAASPDIDVVFDDRVTAVSGTLGVPRAEITVRAVPESAVTPSADAVVHRQGAEQTNGGRRITVDIATELSEDVRFAGFGLQGNVSGGVRVRGGTGAPYTGLGRLTVTDGRYRAYGQELVIERGELVFNGPLDEPTLDVRATRDAGEVMAGIELRGTPANLRSSLFSEPALSDAEALSYLLTGRPLTGATDTESGDTLNQAAFALGLSGAGTVVSQVRSSLGLETLAVEGGSENGRIIAGKRIGNRLLVEYGYGIIDKLGTLLLRYQLNERLVLESRTGTVGNLDIVYSVRKQ